MTSDIEPSIESDSNDTVEQAPNTWLNALLGAAVTVFLSFIPFSPVLGGGVAGYLEGGDMTSGGKVGVLSGVFAAVPLVLIVVAFAGFVFIGGIGRAIVVLAFLALVLVGFYTVVLSALGGILGVYVKETV